MARLAVLLCCYNRRDRTIAALDALYTQRLPPGISLNVCLVDDGSTDGTAEAVAELHPDVMVLSSDGDLYWAGAMRMGMQYLCDSSHFDFLLWLNDDVELRPRAILTLLEVAESSNYKSVVVGATSSGVDDSTTYSGFRKTGKRPMQLERVTPNGRPEPCATMNGNIVLMPREAVFKVGVVDAGFRHSMADIDYGYRCRAHGYEILLAPDHLGRCERNTSSGTFDDITLGRSRRLSLLFSVKGVPFQSTVRINRRYAGRSWSVLVAAFYARALVMIMFGRRVSR